MIYGAHFLVKKQRGKALKVMSLEALWSAEGLDQQDILAAVARDQAAMADKAPGRRVLVLQTVAPVKPGPGFPVSDRAVEPMCTPPKRAPYRPGQAGTVRDLGAG